MSAPLPGVEIDARGAPAGTVLWLHGLGASGHDFEPIVPLLNLPHVRFVFPHAPARPVTINGGLVMPAWYDIRVMSAAGGEDADSVRESATLVEAWIAREKALGIGSDRVVLAGFSQGGAMALFVGVRHPQPLRGIMVLSGYEVVAQTREAETSDENRATPLLFGHGTYDPMVNVARARAAFAAYATPGRDAAWREFPMAHEVCPEEIVWIREWLSARFPTPA
ncbi:MAG TPA: alpha/beta fold hydrolase [Vicinamibacteria bacterium]|jgi:phospholipase/carboxylesterase|nr:alpha/beta fold hydrolase [Vicinamibacteria bacterium]